MRAAVVVFAALVVAGCGAASRQAQRPAAENWPPVAEEVRAHWYRGLEQAAAEPVTLTEADLRSALEQAADAAGVVLVRTHYVALLGGTAELVVRPKQPLEFADEAGALLANVLGPLGRNSRPYLVVVVDEHESPLLVLGWTPYVGGALGEGIAWQAPGIHSSAIVGQLDTRDATAALPAPAASVGDAGK